MIIKMTINDRDKIIKGSAANTQCLITKNKNNKNSNNPSRNTYNKPRKLLPDITLVIEKYLDPNGLPV